MSEKLTDMFTGIYLPKPNAQFEDEYVTKVPSEGEVRLVANRQRQCGYYYAGIDYCRNRMVRFHSDPENSKYQDGFLPCKRLVDAYYRCLTDNKYGSSLEEAPEVAQQSANEFLSCAFNELSPIQLCKKYFNSVLRDIYRSPENSLDDSY